MLKSIFYVTILLLVSCTKGSFKSDGTYSTQLSKIRNSYLNTRELVFYKASSRVSTLKSITNNFSQVNSQANYDLLVNAWLNCRYDFLLTSPYWYGDNSITIPGSAVIGRMEVYPVNLSYIDYTSTNALSGIINDEVNFPTINVSNLKLWHQQGSFLNVTCGLHALECMIWGEDDNNSSPGNRPLTDFQNARRRQFLKANISIFEDDFNDVKNQTQFKSDFLKLTPQQSFKFIISGLSEFVRVDFALNSIKKPLDSYSQNDEISQFSDNTFKDLKAKLAALNLALDPRDLYFSTSEYFIVDFIKEIDVDMYDRIQSNLTVLNQKINFQTLPFDQAIQNTVLRQELQSAYDALMSIDQDLQSLKSMIK
jgi:uncharacterized iron-regulated protein